MGKTPSKLVQEAFKDLVESKAKEPDVTAAEAARAHGIHVTTLYRHKPYQDWRKSMKEEEK